MTVSTYVKSATVFAICEPGNIRRGFFKCPMQIPGDLPFDPLQSTIGEAGGFFHLNHWLDARLYPTVPSWRRDAEAHGTRVEVPAGRGAALLSLGSHIFLAHSRGAGQYNDRKPRVFWGGPISRLVVAGVDAEGVAADLRRDQRVIAAGQRLPVVVE